MKSEFSDTWPCLLTVVVAPPPPILSRDTSLGFRGRRSSMLMFILPTFLLERGFFLLRTNSSTVYGGIKCRYNNPPGGTRPNSLAAGTRVMTTIVSESIQCASRPFRLQGCAVCLTPFPRNVSHTKPNEFMTTRSAYIDVGAENWTVRSLKTCLGWSPAEVHVFFASVRKQTRDSHGHVIHEIKIVYSVWEETNDIADMTGCGRYIVIDMNYTKSSEVVLPSLVNHPKTSLICRGSGSWDSNSSAHP